MSERIKAVKYPKLEHFSEPNVITTTADFIFSWARSHSVFPFTYGLACCAIEMLSSGFARYDVARYGMEVFRPTPRQCDLMIVAGTVNEKMAPVLKRLYDQMSEPKWVISMGACATSGGPFYDGYNVVNGVDKIVPVDVYIPGCPPRPEALFQGLLELQGKIQQFKFVPDKPAGFELFAADEAAGRRRAPRRKRPERVGLVVGSNPMSMDAIAALLLERFAGDVEDVRIQEPDTVVARVAREKLKDVAARLKADPEIGYETLNWVAGVDRRTAFESVYHVYSWKTNTWIELHVEVPKGKPEVDTVCDIWPAADWHEREAWDMVGIKYLGHPDLRRILLKDDFIGHPLRKDYVDLAENHPHA